MSKKNSVLNAKMIEEVARTAAQAALEYLEKEKQKVKQQKRDNRLRNIRLLLKNYRSFVKHSEKIKEELTSGQKEKVMEELYGDDFAIETIRRSKERTLAMVQFMRRMTDVYHLMCEESHDDNEKRRYQIIYDLYLSEEKMTVEKIAECHFLDKRTVFREVNKACETLSVLIFGVDAIRFE